MKLSELTTSLLSKRALRLLIITTVLALVLVIAAVRWQSTRKISHVHITGAVLIAPQEIIALTKIPEQTLTINDIELSEIERRAKKHPFVKSATAFRAASDAVILQIEERKPIAYILNKGKQYYVDVSGTMLPYRLMEGVLDLPVLTFGKQGIDSTRLAQALSVIQVLEQRDKQLYRNISEVESLTTGEFRLITTDNATPILIGTASNIDAKITRLSAFWNTVHQQSRARVYQYVDVRWSGQIVVAPL